MDAVYHDDVIVQDVTPIGFQRLCGLGKAKKVALVACMRKLLTTLNSMLKHRTRWRTEQPQHA